MKSQANVSRRSLLKAAGALTLSFTIPLQVPARAAGSSLAGSLKNHPRISSWLRLDAEGRVTLMIGKVELGQGILTAVQQVCAEELDVDFGRISIVSGDTARTPDEGVTAGSLSMPQCASAVRQVSAEARHILLDLAAERLGSPSDGLSVTDGTITSAGGDRATYWDLVSGDALEREASGQVRFKAPSDYRYIGKPVPRVDLPPKVAGEPIFIQEMRHEGMVHGRVVRPPTYRASLISVDAGSVESLPGVLKVVRDGSFLGVVAEREEQAVRAAEALAAAATWLESEERLPGSAGIYEWLIQQPALTTIAKDRRRAGGVAVSRRLEATYYRPYQMHASIGPSAAIATLDEAGGLTIDTHSQSVFWTAEAIAKMLRIDPSRVHLRHVQGAGCYGHNLADDAAADAALLARALPGRPLRLQYSREDEHRWEPYGSAMVITTQAGLSATGDVLDWRVDIWSSPHNTRPMRQPGFLLSAAYLERPFEAPRPRNIPAPGYGSERNGIALYDFPGHRVTNHFVTEMPLRVSALRGLGAYANVFATESFIDELAHAAMADPLEYRLRFLKDARARDVLLKAAEAFGWTAFEGAPGRGRGIAFARYKNLACYTAVALEVEVSVADGAIRVVRAVGANDSGEIVNPDGITSQIEGGIIQSLSWSLKEEVTFDRRKVLPATWADYPILRFSEVPPVEVVQINRPGAPFLGTGEGAQGPTVAALANAVFDASGARLRQLPFTPQRVRAAL